MRKLPSPAEQVIQTIERLDRVDDNRATKERRLAPSQAADNLAGELLRSLWHPDFYEYDQAILDRLETAIEDFREDSVRVINKLDQRKYPQARGQRTECLHSVLIGLFHKAGLSDPVAYIPPDADYYAGNFADFAYKIAREVEALGVEFDPKPILRRHSKDKTPR